MKELGKHMDMWLAKTHIDERPVFYFAMEIKHMSEEERDRYQRALVELMSDKMNKLAEGVEELEQQLEEGSKIPEDQVRKLFMCKNAICDYGEEYYLLCRDSDLDLPRTYCQMSTELTDKVAKAVEKQHKVSRTSFLGTLNYEVHSVEKNLEELPTMTAWGSIVFRGLLTLLCLAGIAGLFYLPAAKEFLDGRWLLWAAKSFIDGGTMMYVLGIGAAIVFFATWKEEDFGTAVGTQFVLAIAAAIVVAVLFFAALWLGTGTVERLIVAAVLAVFAYYRYEMIPYDVKGNKRARNTIKEMKEDLSYLIPYAKFCRYHGVRIGADDDIIRHYNDVLNRLEKAKQGFDNPTVTWRGY